MKPELHPALPGMAARLKAEATVILAMDTDRRHGCYVLHTARNRPTGGLLQPATETITP